MLIIIIKNESIPHKNVWMNVHNIISKSNNSCPSTDKWINKISMGYYLAIKRVKY